MSGTNPKVAILMGSDSDLPTMKKCIAELTRLGVAWDISVASAHRTPKRVCAYVAKCEREGVLVFICDAANDCVHVVRLVR